MPKMTNPNAARPLSVQPEDVDHYAALGWTLIGDAPAAAPVEPQSVAKTAVTRKSAAAKRPAKK